MSDTEDIDSIREQKRERLERELQEEEDSGTPDEPIHVEGRGHLEEVTAEHDVVLVDFYADWCGPCQMLEPIVAGLAAETPAAVAKVDVDAHQALAQQYGVRGVPMLLLFADGEAVEQMVGVKQREQLEGLIEQYV